MEDQQNNSSVSNLNSIKDFDVSHLSFAIYSIELLNISSIFQLLEIENDTNDDHVTIKATTTSQGEDKVHPDKTNDAAVTKNNVGDSDLMIF